MYFHITGQCYTFCVSCVIFHWSTHHYQPPRHWINWVACFMLIMIVVVDEKSLCPSSGGWIGCIFILFLIIRWRNCFYSVSNNQVAEIQSRAGKVQGRVVELQEKVQKHNPKKEKLRKFILETDEDQWISDCSSYRSELWVISFSANIHLQQTAFLWKCSTLVVIYVWILTNQ